MLSVPPCIKHDLFGGMECVPPHLKESKLNSVHLHKIPSPSQACHFFILYLNAKVKQHSLGRNLFQGRGCDVCGVSCIRCSQLHQVQSAASGAVSAIRCSQRHRVQSAASVKVLNTFSDWKEVSV
ncbi:hypothetical protein FHG87_012590 [Trinorchestia longiramus]|nr:hypothetical protein FHG87_012590 [Trinorchestia longiramus]